MSEKEELIDLSYWIACNLFGKHRYEFSENGCKICSLRSYAEIHFWPHYSVNEDCALVLHKCLSKSDVQICQTKRGFSVCNPATLESLDDFVEAETLPKAICLFAKKIFYK